MSTPNLNLNQMLSAYNLGNAIKAHLDNASIPEPERDRLLLGVVVAALFCRGWTPDEVHQFVDSSVTIYRQAIEQLTKSDRKN
jgi:hypothetical protein